MFPKLANLALAGIHGALGPREKCENVRCAHLEQSESQWTEATSADGLHSVLQIITI